MNAPGIVALIGGAAAVAGFLLQAGPVRAHDDRKVMQTLRKDSTQNVWTPRESNTLVALRAEADLLDR